MITLFCIRPKGFNVGNDAIYIGMQHFLYEAFGEVVNIITLPATSRYESQAKAGLTARTIHEINQYGHGVIVGGGNLYENAELDVDLNALSALEVPLMLFSLSWGRIYNREGKLVKRTNAMPEKTIYALNDRADYSLARDHVTYGYLKKIGCTKVKLGGCPTIFLDKQAYRLPHLPDQDRDTVLISVRNPDLMNIPLTMQSGIYNELLSLIEYLRKKGLKKIHLLCHDYRDIPFAASFTGIDYIYTGDVYTYLSMLKSCKLNISFRLHSVLPCFSFNTPAIKISYDERALSVMDTIGMSDWNINLMETGDLLKAIKDKFEHIEDMKKVREKAQKTWKGLYGIMSGTFRSFAADVNKYAAKF